MLGENAKMATTPYIGPERRKHVRLGWRRGKLGIFLGRLWALIAYSDTTPVRFMLAMAATLWAFFLFLPGNTFDRPVYRYMVVVAGEDAELKWGLLWSLHACVMWWRIFATDYRPVTSLLINILGVILFTSSTIAILVTMTYPFPAAIATEMSCAFASAWVLVRTHINSEKGWRRD